MPDRLHPNPDIQEIVDVTIAYCWALDTNRWDDLDDVFVPHATAVLGGTDHSDRDSIKERIRDALGPLDDSQHMITNHQVTVDGDRATSRCYLQAQHVRHLESGSPNFIVAGRYEDNFVRTPDGWRIERRVLTVMWTEGNTEVTFGRHKR